MQAHQPCWIGLLGAGPRAQSGPRSPCWWDGDWASPCLHSSRGHRLFLHLCIFFIFVYFSDKERHACHYKKSDTAKINKAEITAVNILLGIWPFCLCIVATHYKDGSSCSLSLSLHLCWVRCDWHIKRTAILVEGITTNNYSYSASLHERKDAVSLS